MSGTKLNADSANLCADVLMTMDVVVLQRISPRKYRICGMVPYFYTQLFPQQSDGAHCENPWHYSPMLEYFLDEIEHFFDRRPDVGASLCSGIWVEQLETGDDLPLVATARVMQDAQVLLLKAIREEYAERVRILRKARVELLERRKMTNALNTFKKRALYDPLTKLYNRSAFLDILQNQISNLRTYSPNLALLMLDIDDFKKINDDLGHLAGDSVLSKLGEIMRASLRKNDAPVRYGGEEFIVIAANTNLEQSALMAEKVRKIVEEYDFGIGRQVTISLGCTIYRPGEDSRDFIARVDEALYEAKRAGKNRVVKRDPWSNRQKS